MTRNRRILIGVITVVLMSSAGYYFWNRSRIASGLRVLTGNVVAHTKTQIAFGTSSSVRDIEGISVLDIATGAVTPLTMNRGFQDFHWSPDGETLLLETGAESENETSGLPDASAYWLTVNSAVLKPAPEFNNLYWPPVSPDGSQILYSNPFPEAAAQPSSQSIEIKSVGKDDKHTIAQGVAAAWSHDGTQIAFAGSQGSDADTEIYIMNKDGSDQRRLLQSPGVDTFPTWSFDGQYIAFVSAPNEENSQYPTTLSITDIHGKTVLPLGETLPGQFAWSPTAHQLIFARWSVGGNSDSGICIADADSGTTQCIPKQPQAGVPGWSPDGQQVVFLNDKQNVCVFNLQQQKTTCYEQAIGYEPQWRP